MRLALNEDLEEDEEEVMMEEEDLEENAAYKVFLYTSQFFKLMSVCDIINTCLLLCRVKMVLGLKKRDEAPC